MNLMPYALEDANEIHSRRPDVWVTITQMHGQTILKWGHIEGGQRKTAIQTITYHEQKDGTVYRSRYTHA